MFSRSADDGRIWTTAKPLNSNAKSNTGADWGPHVATDRKGTWVVVWNSEDDLDGTIGTDRDILMARFNLP